MKKFWRYIQGNPEVRSQYYIGILFGIIFAAAGGFSMPFIIYKVLPWVFEGGESMESWKMWVILFAVPGVFTVRGIAGYLNAIFINKGGFKILESIRNTYFQKLLAVEVSFFNKMGIGELVSRLTADGTVVQQTLTEAANDVVKQPLQLLWAMGFLVYLSIQNPQVSLMLAALFVIPLCVIPVQAFGKQLFRKAKKQQEELGDLSDRLTDVTLGAREIRSFCAEPQFIRSFSERLVDFLKTQMKVVVYYHALSPSIEIITTLGVGFAFLVAFHLQIRQNEFMALLAALYMCYEPVKKIGVLANRFQRGQAALDRMEAITLIEPSIKDAEHPLNPAKLSGRIAFENVGFSYTEIPTLQEVSFEIQPGEKVAVVGPSGAGKSTLIQLLPRFYDVQTGAIKFDGHDIRDLSMRSLRGALSLVSQDPVLFSGTFRDNLLVGNPAATAEEIETAAKKAFIHDFIMDLPDGYETQTGQRGLNLSGGQKQRIALARAFLKQAPVLVMDEATSALDSESEENIQKALASLFEDVTALIIAHRFSSIRFVDRILVLDKGKLVADGSHETLMASCELYQKLYSNQIQ
jgi:subfamily B ATP-binding cassette protein MsbA